MSHQRTFIFCVLAIIVLNGCFRQGKQITTQDDSEALRSEEIEVVPNLVLPQISDRFPELVTTDATELFQSTLQSHLWMIAEDFQKKGKLYESWLNDKDAASLYFSWKERDYNLEETIELVCVTIQKIESPIFVSNYVMPKYIDPNSPCFTGKLTFPVLFTLTYCAEINTSIGDEDGAVSIIKLRDSFSDQICVYDFISYMYYYGAKDGTASLLEQVALGQFSHVNVRLIIDILRKNSADIDKALDVYLFSERAIIANVASSILTNKDEYEEAKKTIRYLDAIIEKRNLLKIQEIYSEEKWWLGADIPQTEPSEVEDAANKVLEDLIATRLLYVSGCIMSNERYKARIDALINKFNAVLQEAP